MEWTKIEFVGSPPANRLDFACCTVKLCIADKKDEVTSTSVVDQCPASVTEQDMAKLKIVSSDAPPHECHRAANIIELNIESNMAAGAGIVNLYFGCLAQCWTAGKYVTSTIG
jgi:hypothetical protein